MRRLSTITVVWHVGDRRTRKRVLPGNHRAHLEVPGDVVSLYATFFSRAVSGFLLFDKDLKLIDFNKSASKLLGIKKEEAIGKSIAQFSLNITQLGLEDRFMKVIQTGRPLTLKNLITNISSGRLILDIRAFKAENGLGIIISDMTRFNSSIEEFNLLVYKLSHEMRSPNSTIRGLVNAARLDARDEQRFYEYLSLINKEARKLDAILKELSHTVEVRAGSIVVSKIEMKNFVDEVVKSMAQIPDIDKIKIQTTVRLTRPFFCYRFALITIFQNLIENAIKYRRFQNGESYLQIDIEDKDKGIQITLKDNGIGIEEQALSQIFKMFFRGTRSVKRCVGSRTWLVNPTIFRVGSKQHVCSCYALIVGPIRKSQCPLQRQFL
jgi:signal transduction histidine kinase